MNARRWTVSFCVVCLFMPSLAPGHHSSAIYDMSQQVTVEGTVTRIAWANPHVYIHLEEVTDSGEVIAWAVEAYPPAAMRRIGWTDTTLQAGDTVTVVGRPTRRMNNRGLFPSRIETGGLVLFQAETMLPQLSRVSAEPEVGASSIAGTWETLASLELILRFYGTDIPTTAAGTAARDSYDETSMLPALECIPYSAPLLMIDPDFKQIVVADDRITIHGGFAPAERTIHMNVVTHDGAAPSLQGHSIGHWEGTTLVIDTANFVPHRIGNGYRGSASGVQKHLVERLALQDDGRKLSYSFELTDTEFLMETVTGSVEWAYRPDLEFVREPCELDNAREFID